MRPCVVGFQSRKAVFMSLKPLFKTYPQLLPRSSTELERGLDQTAQFTADIDPDYTELHDPWRCPVCFLPFLAWMRSVDEYDDEWPEFKKRSVIAESPEVHLRKGTIESIRRAIRAAGFGEVTIIENWHTQKHNRRYQHNSIITYTNGDGHWAKYGVVMAYQISNAQARNVRNILNATAPARCELVELRYSEPRKHDATFQHNGEFSYGVN